MTARDNGWLGVNMRLEPHLLPRGYAASATNLRFTRGIAETRKGLEFPRWAQKPTLDAGNYTFGPWGTLYGLGVYRDAISNLDFLIIAADEKIYRVHPHNVAVEMTLPAGVTIAEPCTFTQAGGYLICHRGFDTAPLWLERITAEWQTLPSPDPSSGAEPMPYVERSVYFGGRLWAAKDDDTIAVSDFNDPTSFQPVTQELYINPGTSDAIVALWPIGRSTLVVFKSKSIFVLYNAYGDLAALTGSTVTLQFGCVAPESIVDVGNELWFLSQDGVRSVIATDEGQGGFVRLKTETNATGQEVPVLVSEPLQPLIDRINWRHIAGATGAYWNRRYYLSMPLDDAEVQGRLVFEGEQLVYEWQLTVGRQYRFEMGDATLTCNAVVYDRTQIFVAGASTCVAFDSNVPGRLTEVWPGVNTHTLVFDFANGAWSGVDEVPGISMARFVPFEIGGKAQLMCMTQRGYVGQYEVGAEDQNPDPYADVILTAAPTVGDTIQINGGDTVTVQSSDYNHTVDGLWGDGLPDVPTNFEAAAHNLYVDYEGSSGFAYQGDGYWDRGNTFCDQITDGIRVISSDGLPITITTTGTWGTVTHYNTLPIEATLVTRGYTAEDNGLQKGITAWIDLQTWAADVSGTFINPGVNESVELGTWTPDRTKWLRPADRAAFVQSNPSDTADDKWREDYSIELNATTEAAGGIDLGSDGLTIERDQETRQEWTTQQPTEWRSGQVSIINTAGRMRVLGVMVEGAPAGNRGGVTA